jgi:hypothetical protein
VRAVAAANPSTIQLNQLRVIFAARSEVVVKNAQALHDEVIEPSKQRSVTLWSLFGAHEDVPTVN